MSFAPPEPVHPDGRNPGAPVVNAFLSDVRLERIAEGSLQLRDGKRVVERLRPAVVYRLCYLLSAWGTDTLAEHALLGMLLCAGAQRLEIPADCLRGTLAEPPAQPLPLVLGPEETAQAGWGTPSALHGLPPHTYLDASLLVPLHLPPLGDLAPAPARTDLGVGRTPVQGPPPTRPQADALGERQRGRIIEREPGNSGAE